MPTLNDDMAKFYEEAFKVFLNEAAMNVQFYTEANVKNGQQFAAAVDITDIPASGQVAFLFRTGNLPVSIKARELQIVGLKIRTRVLKGATFTEGNLVDVYGHRDGTTQNATTMVIKEVTGVSGGTDVFVPRTFYGTDATNQTPVQPRPTVTGLENILDTNTDYVLLVENLDTGGTVSLELYATWYEGLLDYPKE